MPRRWLLWTAVALMSAVFGQSEAVEPACTGAGCVNVVFDGDSISAGWGAPSGHGLDAQVVAGLGTGVHLHNVAAGGRPVSDCLQLFQKLVVPLFDATTPHNVIVFHGGDNDVLQGRNAVQTYAAFTVYVAKAHQQGWKVVVSTEMPRKDFHPPQSAELEAYNNSLRRNQAGADAVVDFDTDSRMTDLSRRDDPALFSHDHLHPSEGGYTVLSGMLIPAVRRVIGR